MQRFGHRVTSLPPSYSDRERQVLGVVHVDVFLQELEKLHAELKNVYGLKSIVLRGVQEVMCMNGLVKTKNNRKRG